MERCRTSPPIQVEEHRIDAILSELRVHLATIESGRVLLSWHWGQGQVRYDVTMNREFRAPIAIKAKR